MSVKTKDDGFPTGNNKRGYVVLDLDLVMERLKKYGKIVDGQLQFFDYVTAQGRAKASAIFDTLVRCRAFNAKISAEEMSIILDAKTSASKDAAKKMKTDLEKLSNERATKNTGNPSGETNGKLPTGSDSLPEKSARPNQKHTATAGKPSRRQAKKDQQRARAAKAAAAQI